MAKICIVYAHADLPDVQRLVGLLENAYLDVWWDQSIDHGKVRSRIQDALGVAAAVVVVWSKAAVQSDWVPDEAQFARDHNKPLVPVRLESVRLPLGFGQFKTLDLSAWRKTGTWDSSIADLLSTLQKLAGVPAKREVRLNGRSVELPCFFFVQYLHSKLSLVLSTP